MPGEAIRVPLSRGMVALIDADDAERILAHKWHLKRKRTDKRVYAQRTVRLGSGRNAPKTAVMLHREVMRAGPGEVIDHVNGDTLDNRKANLRRCTARQNVENIVESANQRRGRFKGVYQPKKTWRWCAAIAAGELRPNSRRKRLHLGSYDTAEQAAEAYDLAALQNYGEFAALNFPDKRPEYIKQLGGAHG